MQGSANAASDPEKEHESLKKALKREFGLQHILGVSKEICRLKERLDKVSSCEVNVLISGESGTGKELSARAIHYLSSRSEKPFIPVNCGAIPDNLFENELFGHVRGAFTDAKHQQTGLVEEAEGGSLFLDEISALTPYVQVKLLRLLQNKEYKPLGKSRPRTADIRIIAATNNDLESLVKDGAFREDLYYRLSIVSIHIPPLRKRKDDIPSLIEHFMRRYSTEYGKDMKEISLDAMDTFVSYPWPGNIRELENKIQQLVVMCTSSTITCDDINLLPKKIKDTEDFRCLRKAKKSFEKVYLTDLLQRNKGNVVSAAKSEEMSRTALWNLLKKHNLSPKDFR